MLVKRMVFSSRALFVLLPLLLLFSQGLGQPAVGKIPPSVPDVLVFSGVSMAPLRALAELLGAEITTAGGSVTVTRNGKSFTCTMGKTAATANGAAVKLPRAPFVRGAAGYAPLRPLVEALGGTLALDAENSLVSVNLDNPTVTVSLPRSACMEYMRDVRPGFELYLVPLDGSGARRLTYTRNGVSSPAISPDGTRLAYCRNDTLVIRSLDAPAETVLPQEEETYRTSLAFTPDSTALIYTRGVDYDGEDQLFYRDMSVEASDWDTLKELEKAPPEPEEDDPEICRLSLDNHEEQVLAQGYSPRISPDGMTIAYILTENVGEEEIPIIHLMDRDGAHQRMVGVGFDPIFNRNSDRLLFTQLHRGEDGKITWAQAVAILSGERAGTVIEGDPKVIGEGPCGRFSPDGTRIVYADCGLATVNSELTEPVDVTFDSGDEAPLFTPDGSRIVFTRVNALYAVDPKSGDAVRLAEDLTVSDRIFTPDGACLLATASTGRPRIYFLDMFRDTAARMDPPYTPAQAQECLREVLPLVERVTGKKFAVPPVLKVVGPEEMTAVVAREILPRLRTMNPSFSAREIKQSASLMAEAVAHALLGKFGVREHILYLIPDNHRLLAELVNVSPETKLAYLKLIIAHELTHALQEQETGAVDRLVKTSSLDTILTLAAVTEGQAVFIQDQVAAELHLEEESQEFTKLTTSGKIRTSLPMSAALDTPTMATVQRLFADIYLRGRDFIAWHFRDGGMDRVWQVVGTPPVQSRVIYHPELYRADAAKPVDYAPVLQGIEGRFGKQEWRVQNLEIGEMVYQAMFADEEPAVRDRLLAGLVHTQSFIANADGAMGSITMTVFRTPEEAQAALPVLAKVGSAQLSAARQLGVIHANPPFYIPAPGIHAGEAEKGVALLDVLGQRAVMIMTRITHGNVILEMSLLNVPKTDKEISAIAEEIFQRVPAE